MLFLLFLHVQNRLTTLPSLRTLLSLTILLLWLTRLLKKLPVLLKTLPVLLKKPQMLLQQLKTLQAMPQLQQLKKSPSKLCLFCIEKCIRKAV